MGRVDKLGYWSADADDIEQIRELLRITGLYYGPIDDHSDWYVEKLRHDPHSIIVAEDAFRVVGVVWFTFDPLLSVIAHLAVSPDYQRIGVGRNLFQDALKRIKNRGGRYVAGYIVAGNDASIELCKSEGLEVYDQPVVAVSRVL